MKYQYTAKTVLDWATQFSSAKTYFSKLNGSASEAAMNLWHYSNWAGLDPDKLLALKASFSSLKAEKLLDRFVCDGGDLPLSTKWHVVQAVRGFYRCNYRVLQPEAGKMEYTPMKPQRCPSKSQRMDLYRACYNPRDRALIMVTLCSSIALDTLSKLRFYHFEPDWRRQTVPHISIPGELVKGRNRGKYKGVRQEGFITPECKRVLIEYTDWMSKNFGHRWTDDSFVFLDVRQNLGKPMARSSITRAVAEVARRAGVGFGTHDGRRIVQTALESVGASPNWIKKVKGRKVSGEESPYSKPAVEQLREKYREALPELEFMSEAKSADLAFTDEELRMIRDMLTERVKKLSL